MTDSLLAEGVRLLLAGMLTVAFFLTLLVFATTLLSRLVQRWWPLEESVATAAGAGVSPTEVAAITAAIHQHRHAQQSRFQQNQRS